MFRRRFRNLKRLVYKSVSSSQIHPVMITSIVLLVLPLVAASGEDWLPTCGVTQKQNLLGLISTDIFVRHFNSGALNSTLTECSNFHRHICPKEGMSSSASTQGIVDQIVAIERSCTKYDVYKEIQKDFVFADNFDPFDYTNTVAISSYLYLLPMSTLFKIYEYTSLHIQKPINFYSSVWDRRHWTPALDQAKFPSKYDPTISTGIKKKTFVNTLASDIKTIIDAGKGIKNMTKAYLSFIKDVTDYNHVVGIMFREGIETGVSRDRHHDAIIKVAEEYGRALENAAWSSLDYNGKTRYDRFYDELMDIYDNTLRSDLNNYGTQNASGTFAKDFYNFYLEERNNLCLLTVFPTLRNLIAVNRAHERVIATIDLDMANRWAITASPTLPNVISGFFVFVCVRNQAIFDLIIKNSPDSAVFGSIAYVYGHELYHGVERDLYPTVMPTSPVVTKSIACANVSFTDIAQRFPLDKRFLYWPHEEQADIYGTQIAYGAFKTALGNRIDDLAYPSLGITHRQLFFYANSIFGCNVHDETFINGEKVLYEAHYEVNGRLAQVPEFKTTFQCSASDNMVIPESQHCPIFFPTYTS